jgi:hypothetical protein
MKKAWGLAAAVICVSTLTRADDVIFDDGYEMGSCVADPDRSRMQTIGIFYADGGDVIVDATRFDTIFGHVAEGSPVPFPGIPGIGSIWHWTASGQYYSGAFLTPADMTIPHGSLNFQDYESRGCTNFDGSPGPCGQPFYDVSISTQCNDYGASAVYVALNVPSTGEPGLVWAMNGTPGSLQPDTAYFLNIRMHDPADYWRSAAMIWY